VNPPTDPVVFAPGARVEAFTRHGWAPATVAEVHALRLSRRPLVVYYWLTPDAEPSERHFSYPSGVRPLAPSDAPPPGPP